ncbi:hypothetical protein RA263_28505, partial [Pseudomonas syringae pv. tagetis]|uniref:hypothetical protein n=1 Tax=Pseudomonas syringae group genomosp. 7 TaxID=251699 RepID=UPI00377060B0
TILATDAAGTPNIQSITIDPNGDIYLGGAFVSLTLTGGSAVTAANIARYTGSGIYTLGTGVSGGVVSAFKRFGNIYIAGGTFT